MGFLDFLKAKKGGKKEEQRDATQDFQQTPLLPSEPEMYSELPNLPEVPEMPGLPEIELPPPLKGLEDFDFPKRTGDETDKKHAEIPSTSAQYKTPAEPLIPEWPAETKLKLPEASEDKPWENIPAEVPELKMPEPENHPDMGPGVGVEVEGSFVSHKSGFFLKAENFRMVKDNIDAMLRAQKKHHKLTEIKKEENSHYEQMSIIIEDAQRKLMHIDRTLFE